MTNHVKIIGWLYIILGALGVLVGCVVFAILLGSGALSGDETAFTVTGIVGLVVGGIAGVLSLPSILGGWGVLRYYGWARVLLLIIGALNLPAFPLGTALGIYTFWGLLNEDSNRLFA
ncbi:MAG: hypothetical protein ACLFU8_02110 [Anaerolineales bacterium]